MTKMLLALASATALASVATVADAQDGRAASATLATAPAHTQKLVLGDFRWICDGAACTGAVGGGKVDVVRTCRELSRKLGEVSRFTVAGSEADPETLGACNSDVKKIAKTN